MNLGRVFERAVRAVCAKLAAIALTACVAGPVSAVEPAPSAWTAEPAPESAPAVAPALVPLPAAKPARAMDPAELRDASIEAPVLPARKPHAIVRFQAPVPPAATPDCLWPRALEKKGTRCTCVDGYTDQDGHCVLTAPLAQDTDVPDPRDVAHVQRCLSEAGFLEATPGSAMTAKAWQAFRHFKAVHKVGATPEGIYNPRARRLLFALCPSTFMTMQGVATSEIAAIGADSVDQRAMPRSQAALPPRLARRPETACLPADLHKLLTSTYGPRPGLATCAETCVAPPQDLSLQERADYEAKRGVTWCHLCVELRSYLPLDEIVRIEQGAKARLCRRPPTRLVRWADQARPARTAYTKVREIFRRFPPRRGGTRQLAVLIGNRTYGRGLGPNAAAHTNTSAVYTLLSEHLGVRHEDIIDLRDATLEDLRQVFGTGEGRPGELQRRLRRHDGADVLVYYAGHGISDADTGESYLLPVDAVRHREAHTAYPLSELYARLAALEAGSVTVLLEAAFAGDVSDVVFPPNLPEMQVRALPRAPVAGLTVMTAGDGDQKILDAPRYGVGLFTRYLIEGLAGQADRAPIGNGDGRAEPVELYVFVAHKVRLAARKSYGLLQRPRLSTSGKIVESRIR